MGRAGVQIIRRILRRNASPGLQSAGKRPKGAHYLPPARLIIGRISVVQQDHMAAGKASVSVQRSIVRSVLPGHKILPGAVPLILQAAAYDLFYLSVMYVYTWPKTHMLLQSVVSEND